MDDSILMKCLKVNNGPMYIYDKKNIIDKLLVLSDALFDDAKIYYSMKANPLLGICKLMINNGCGIEVASKGELFVALKAGASPKNIIFTSPGKTYDEIDYAIDCDIKVINVDSFEEIKIINKLGENKNKIVKVGLRINPSVSFSNAKIKMTGVSSQFGIEEGCIDQYFIDEILKMKYVEVVGIQVYMGTNILDSNDIVKNSKYIIDLCISLEDKFKYKFKYLNLGGGFGIPYFKNEPMLDINDLKIQMNVLYENYRSSLSDKDIIFESGRFLMAESGCFITKVLYKKESKGQKYIICDGGSNFHSASAFLGRFIRNNYPMHVLNKNNDIKEKFNVVGPLCTPTDVIGQNVELDCHINVNDYIVIEKSGAYGLTYSPCLFLGHEMPNEYLYDGEDFVLLRSKGNLEDVLINQSIK
ncbi:diaminopimelate decarboxylase [Inconstantimicrobium mannanitabidum]|uniref:Diaminopimelate decarboxylase n=1 Tax=Inconstantimicrobium mannanitabidum TaxID=1604901 RepID=A0ACB5RH33_9CLOT|nr:diaminopimelate decarboxylase [Clostridium sp. TW13]GKX68390.1 diaminopimelate decarboxylase [Clostridium sp. TW13]